MSESSDEDFIRLFSVHQRALFLHILPLVGNAADADEVLQETNVIMWAKREQYQPGTNFLAWGRAIARLEVFRFRRKRGTKLRFLEEGILEAVADRTEAVSDQMDARQEALRHCLERLRPKDRELIRMRYATGKSGEDVAQQLGRPANSVYQSLSRIRRTLAECIERRLTRERPV